MANKVFTPDLENFQFEINQEHSKLQELRDPFTELPIKTLENKPPLVRMGGKRYLAKLIVPRIDSYDYSLYVEPFFGGGRIYFEKKPHFAEIINDKEARLANFFFCCRHWADELQKKQEYLIKDENSWYDIYDYHNSHYTEICEDLQSLRKNWYEAKSLEDQQIYKERMLDHAIDFFFLSNMAFRGSLTARTMTHFENDPRTEANRMRWRIYRPLGWIGMRMRRTMVLNRDFAKVVKIALKYSNHSRIWYLDPPYWEVEGYEHEFPWENYELLSELLQSIPETDYFLMSLNNKPAIRELFSWCNVEEVQTHYTTGGAGQKKDVTELIFTPKWNPAKKPFSTVKLTSFLKK